MQCMDQKKLRILILTDSLGCPRKETPVEKTWVERILRKYSGDFIFYTYCEHGLSTEKLKMDYIMEINPDIIVCQIGIVDACRRVFSKRFINLISVIKPLSKMVNYIARKYHRFFTSIRNLHYVNKQEFQQKIETLVSYARKVVFISIAPPGDSMIEKIYNVKEDVNEYNKVFLNISNGNESCIFLNPYESEPKTSKFLLEDGHHLSDYGEDIVCSVVDSYLKMIKDN